MGCNDSNLARYDTDDEEEERRFNEVKSQEESWRDLPKIHFINNTKIEKFFILKNDLGIGGSCRVRKVKKRENKEEFAMKELVRDDPWNPILFKQEIEILSRVSDHPNILNYCESYVHEKYLYVCTKLCTGGELFDKVKQLTHFSEKGAAKVLQSVLDAIFYVHSRNIAHRDLKPENIVYADTSPKSPIVIIDFGDASPIESDHEIFSDFVGTPFYLAPECIRHRAGWELCKSDMWAIGVIAYVLLTGRPPFFGRNNREILMKITQAHVKWPKNVRLSSSAKNFVLSLLQKDCRLRLSAKEALKHPWIVSESHKHNAHLGDNVIRNIRKFQNACRLKKLIVIKMVESMSDEEKKSIAEAFSQLDINGDGFVDKEELCQYLRDTGMTHEKCQTRATQLIMGMDKDGDGKIDLNEWITGKTVDNLTSNADLIDQQFHIIAARAPSEVTLATDSEMKDDEVMPIKMIGPKTITTEQIMIEFSNFVDEADLEDIVREVDENGDGVISLEEFQNAMQQFTIRQ